MNGQPITDIVGLYYDKLPPREKTLLELVILASDAMEWRDSRFCPDSDYNARMAEFDTARDALWSRLETMGLDRPLIFAIERLA